MRSSKIFLLLMLLGCCAWLLRPDIAEKSPESVPTKPEKKPRPSTPNALATKTNRSEPAIVPAPIATPSTKPEVETDSPTEDIAAAFAKAEPISRHPELIQSLRQQFTGVIANPQDQVKFADFALNTDVDLIENRVYLTFEFTEPNGNRARFDSQNAAADQLFRVARRGETLNFFISIENQWLLQLAIDLRGARPISGKFYRQNAYVGDIKSNEA